MTNENSSNKKVSLPLEAWIALQNIINLGASIELTPTKFVLWSPLTNNVKAEQAIQQLYTAWAWVDVMPLEVGIRTRLAYDLNNTSFARIATEPSGNINIKPLTSDVNLLFENILDPDVPTEIQFHDIKANQIEAIKSIFETDYSAKISVVGNGDQK